jgi:hypothetical protein
MDEMKHPFFSNIEDLDEGQKRRRFEVTGSHQVSP